MRLPHPDAAISTLTVVKDSPSPPTPTPCDTCIQIAGQIEDYLADPVTQDTVVSFVQNNLCSILPTDSARTCKQEARVLVAQAVASMEQSVTPIKICTYLGTCHAEEGVNTITASFPVPCPICKLVMSNVLTRLKDPSTREQIYDNAMVMCDEMAEEEAMQKCKDDIVQLFDSLDSLLDDLDVVKACEVLQFCHAESDDVTHMVQLSGALQRLSELLQELSSLPPPSAANDDEDCKTCKSIVAEAVAILMNPDTQKEIMDFAKEGCAAFEDWEEQCDGYVDQYGPMMIGVAISYLQPLPLCERMGYCDAPSAVY